MTDPDRVRHSLTGPISSVRTPFTESGEVDYDGLRQTIDFNISAGSRTMLLTAGDSHYIALSDAEIAEVTRVTVEHTAGRALVVAADRQYATGQAVEFARYCTGVGADVLMVLPPDWAASTTPTTLAEHYAAVAQHIPVMLVTGIFRDRGDAFGRQTIELVLAQESNVVAVKDDVCGTFARRLGLLVGDRWSVFAGGQKQNHMNAHPYGCHGYLSTFITFKPEIAKRYWQAVEADDLAEAASVIAAFDLPFFDLLGSMPGGFDAGIHGVLELFGICRRWRRRPYHSLTEAQVATLADGLRKLALL